MSTLSSTSKPAHPDDAVEAAIRDAIRAIRYGSVEIMIHDARVVQIERKEKIRFASDR
jgi:hypothetical protein